MTWKVSLVPGSCVHPDDNTSTEFLHTESRVTIKSWEVAQVGVEEGV